MAKIIFMGTPDFAKTSLEALYNNGFEIVRSCNKPRQTKRKRQKNCRV